MLAAAAGRLVRADPRGRAPSPTPSGWSPAGAEAAVDPDRTRVPEQEVAAANEAFYAAVERGDLDALQRRCGATRTTAVCVHPGAAPIHGTRNVLRSWALIMANTDYIQFFLTDVEVSLNGDVAAVTCRENILTAADSGPHGLQRRPRRGAQRVRPPPDGWRLWLHQAAPVVSEAG